MAGIHLVPQQTAGWIWAHILLLYTLPALSILIGLGLGFVLSETWRGIVGGASAGVFVGGLFVGIFFWANWPIQAQYHTYVPTTITVAQIGSRFLGDGNGGTNQRYVFLDTNGVPYAVDDTRASLVKVGEVVTLMCVREWQQNGVPGFACNWGEVGPNA